MIKDDAKKIVKYMLDQSISRGDLCEVLFIHYADLAKELDLQSENYCRVCCQYLDELQYINILENDNGTRSIRLTAKGIVFLEST